MSLRPLLGLATMLPLHAFALKKNRCGIGPVSKVCDNDDTAASLGHSEILSIEDTPSRASFRSRNHARVCPSSDRLDGGISAHKSAEEASESVSLV